MPCDSILIDPWTNPGDHTTPHPSVFLRLLAMAPRPLLDLVPLGVPPKLYSPLAHRVSLVVHFHCILRHGGHRPLPLVLPLRSCDTGREGKGARVLPRAASHRGSWFCRHSHFLWGLCLALAFVPVPQSERE